MAGWFPAGSDSWPLVVELLQARGEPWPYDLILDDLAWWADGEKVGRGKRPGRPTLAKRWGVSDRQVRNALRDPDWKDRQRTASGQLPDSERTASGQVDNEPTPPTKPKRTASGQEADSERTASVHTRVEAPYTHTPPTPENTSMSEPKGSDEAWQRLHDLYQKHGGGKLRGRSKGMGQMLNTRLNEYDEASVAKVIVWANTSQHKRARELREGGWTTLKTLMRASNFEEYLGFASVPDRRDEPVFEQPTEPKAPPPPAPEPHPEATKAWEAVLEQLQGHIGHQDIEIWLRRPVTPTGLTADGIELTVDNDYYLDWIAEHYAEDIQDALGPRVLTLTLQRAPLRLVEPG